MIKIKIDDKVIEVKPKLTIRQYQTIQRNPNRYTSTTEILALYLGLTAEELKDLPVDQIEFVSSILTSHILNPKSDLVYTFKHNDITYGLENDWGNMTWGQWTDMEVFSQDDKITDNIHILMALLYRPILKEKDGTYKLEKYKSSEVMERAEGFLDIPIEYWFSCANFFFHISKEYASVTKHSLKKKIQREIFLLKILKRIPSFLIPKRLRDSFLNSLTNSHKRI
jgi:hypothetical protein